MGGMSARAHLVCLFLAFGLAVCSACTLGSAMYSTCSTSVANGLTDQLVSEMKNMGYSFTSMTSPNYTQYIHCDYSQGCQPYLQQGAAEALLQAAQSKQDYITL